MKTGGFRVTGMDTSLGNFGMAVTSGPGLLPMLYRFSPKIRGHERLELLLGYVREYAAGSDLVVIEGLAYGAKGNALLDLAGLGCLVRHEVWKMGIPYALVAPAQVKQFATGNGGADKFAMVEAARQRFGDLAGWRPLSPDEADALWLAAMGAQWLGEPVAALPQAQRAVVWAKWDGKQKGHKRGDPKIVWPVIDGHTPAPAAGLAALF